MRDRETEIFEGRALCGFRGDRGIIHDSIHCDRDRNDRRIKLVRWCEATAIGRGICGDVGYKCTNLPSNVPRSPFRQKGYECYLIVYNCLMDVAPTQVAWNRWRATGTSTSVTSCTSLPHQFARRAAGGGGGRSRSAYRDERERNDPHTSEDNRIAWRPNREEATGTSTPLQPHIPSIIVTAGPSIISLTLTFVSLWPVFPARIVPLSAHSDPFRPVLRVPLVLLKMAADSWSGNSLFCNVLAEWSNRLTVLYTFPRLTQETYCCVNNLSQNRFYSRRLKCYAFFYRYA